MPSIRTGTTADIPTLWAVRTRAVRAGCASHYVPETIDAWCAAAPPEGMPALVDAGGCMVAEEGGAIAGYAVLDVASGEVEALFVEPSRQGQGIARALMAALEALAGARGIGRLFLSASLNAVPFYRRAGFAVLREEIYPHRSGLALASVLMERRCHPSLWKFRQVIFKCGCRASALQSGNRLGPPSVDRPGRAASPGNSANTCWPRR